MIGNWFEIDLNNDDPKEFTLGVREFFSNGQPDRIYDWKYRKTRLGIEALRKGMQVEMDRIMQTAVTQAEPYIIINEAIALKQLSIYLTDNDVRIRKHAQQKAKRIKTRLKKKTNDTHK